MTDKLYEAEVETRQALLNENARLRERITELERGEPPKELSRAWNENRCGDDECESCRLKAAVTVLTGGVTHRENADKLYAAPPAQEAPAAPMHYTESGCAYTDSDAVKTIWTCSTDNKACPTTTDGKSLCRQNGVCQRVDMDKLPTVKIEIAAPDDQEQCFYCKQWFPKPVSYHHSWDECIAPDATPETEGEKLIAFFCSKEGDELGRAGDHDNLTPAETAIRAMRQRNALRDKLAEAERDAKRYRHMRENAAFQDRDGPMLYWYVPRYNHDLPLGERLDAAIDTAWPERKES